MRRLTIARRPVTVDEEQQALRCANGRVVIIDDDTEILCALSALMDMEDYACETYSSAAAYLQALACDRPAFPGPVCVLCDVKMPEIDGLELLKTFTQLNETPLVLMSGASSAQDVASGFRGGAHDFLVKPMDVDVLLDTLRGALAVSTRRQQALAQQTDLDLRIASLTSREREIARRAANGQTNPEMAYELGIALRTVKLHRQRALEKLGADSIPALVRIADQGKL